MRISRLLPAAIGAILLAFVTAGAAAAPPTAAASPTIYVDPHYGFTLQVPGDLSPHSYTGYWSLLARLGFGSRTGKPVLALTVFHVDHGAVATGQPYPLLFYAEVRVGVSSDTADCYPTVPHRPGATSSKTTTIGGVSFHAIPLGDTGMMKYVRVMSYRTVHEGRCFAVEQIERGSSYRDSSMKPGLSQARLNAYYSEAGEIARSFRFITPLPPGPPPFGRRKRSTCSRLKATD